MKRCLRWLAGVGLAVCLWVAIGQAPSIKVPFATAPTLGTSGANVSIFVRLLAGSYVSLAYGFSSPHALVTGVAAVAQLISEGPQLVAAPAGPANVGRASQHFAGGIFTSAGVVGAAYTADGNNSVRIAMGSANLLYTGTTSYNVGPTPGGVVAGDFNGDGVLDLAIPFLGDDSTGGLAVLINNGDGTFKTPVIYPAGSSPISVATFDLNQDGKLDLAVADNGSSSVYVLLGNGDGTFRPAVAYPASNNGLSITIADFNGDAKPDIAETGEDGNISILINSGSGSFTTGATVKTPSTTPFYIAAGDLNGDGHNDLVTADGYASTVTVFLNTGAGSFVQGLSYATSYTPDSLVITDYNGDGKLDILNATGDARAFGPSVDTGFVDFLIGNGDGTFQGTVVTPAGTTRQYPFLAVADFTGDGIPDAVVNGGSQGALLLPGTKTGAFTAAAAVSTGATAPAGAVAADFNGDGKPDLAVTDFNSSSVAVLLNAGSGFNTPSTFSSGGQGPTGIATADFNGDGKLDVAVANVISATTAIFSGGGDGTFQLAATYPTGVPSSDAVAAGQVVATDLNGDGKPDLIVLNPASGSATNGALYVLLNNRTGGFSSPVTYTPSAFPIWVSAGDINGDGKPDLVVAVQDTQFDFHLAILLNNGSGGFGPATLINTEFGPSSIAIHDFNGDGKADLVVAHCCGQANLTYLQGKGDGTFSAEVDFNGGNSPQLVAVTDFDGNGTPDLAVFLSGSGNKNGMAGLLNKPAGQTPVLTSVSAAGGVTALAPGSLATAYGSDLANGTGAASSTPLPTVVKGSSVSIVDAAGNTTAAPLVFVSPIQINYLIPRSVATGQATVTATSGDGTQTSGQINITSVAPALFTLNASGLTASDALCVSSSGTQTLENVYQVVNGSVVAKPLNLSECSETVLEIFATGMDSVSASDVEVTMGSHAAQVLYGGPQGSFVGLDQINVVIPQSLAGSGSVSITVAAKGQTANTVNVTIH